MSKKKKVSFSPREACKYAYEMYGKKEYEAALDVFLKLKPFSEKNYPFLKKVDINNCIATCYFYLKRYFSAFLCFRRTIEEFPMSISTYVNYASAVQSYGRHEEAIKILKDALVIDQHNITVLDKLSWFYILVGKYKESIVFSKKSFDIEETKFNCANLSTAYFFINEEKKSVDIGKKVLQIRDQDSEIEFKKVEKLFNHLLNQKQLDLLKPLEVYRPRESQNIVSFSLWGNDPTYVVGAIENAKLVHEIYPGWVARFYCDRSVERHVLSELIEQEAQVFILDDEANFYSRYLWRFYVNDDPSVTRFICRDTDCRLNIRERAAVKEWLNSDKNFHVMRDSILHTELMLAGLWGGVAEALPNLFLLHKKLGSGFSKWGDQQFLKDYIWPYIKSSVLVHDTYYQFFGGLFPEVDYDEEVGRGVVVNDEKNIKE